MTITEPTTAQRRDGMTADQVAELGEMVQDLRLAFDELRAVLKAEKEVGR